MLIYNCEFDCFSTSQFETFAKIIWSLDLGSWPNIDQSRIRDACRTVEKNAPGKSGTSMWISCRTCPLLNTCLLIFLSFWSLSINFIVILHARIGCWQLTLFFSIIKLMKKCYLQFKHFYWQFFVKILQKCFVMIELLFYIKRIPFHYTYCRPLLIITKRSVKITKSCC